MVARPRIHSAVLKIPDIRARVSEGGATYNYSVMDDELRPPCCVHLGSEGHHLGRSRFIRSLHLSDALPVMLEDRHIFLDAAAPEAERADFHAEPPSTWLVAHVLWTEAEHRIAAQRSQLRRQLHGRWRLQTLHLACWLSAAPSVDLTL